jgi:hypothetical protein
VTRGEEETPVRKLLSCAPWLALALMGCGGLSGRAVTFAPVVEKPADASWPFALPPLEPEAKKDGPRIQVTGYFLASTPADLERAGIDCGKAASVITPGQFTKLFVDLVRSRRAQVRTAPQLVVVPGQRTRAGMATAYNYLGDYERKKDEQTGARVLVPVMRRILDGDALDVQVELDASSIVFTAIDVKIATGLGLRDCRCSLDVGREVALLTWQEPVCLSGESGLRAGERVTLRPGTAVVLPVHRSLLVATAEARKKLERPVDVVNEKAFKFLSDLDARGFPLPDQIVVVLTAKLAGDKREPAEPPKPN